MLFPLPEAKKIPISGTNQPASILHAPELPLQSGPGLF
jgi:hypothetical protein